MKIYELQSKNIISLSWSAVIALVGTVAMVALNKTNHTGFLGYGASSPALSALYLILYAGVPVLLLASFVYSVFAVGREETKLGRMQVVALMVVFVVLAYVTSYSMFTINSL